MLFGKSWALKLLPLFSTVSSYLPIYPMEIELHTISEIVFTKNRDPLRLSHYKIELYNIMF